MKKLILIIIVLILFSIRTSCHSFPLNSGEGQLKLAADDLGLGRDASDSTPGDQIGFGEGMAVLEKTGSEYERDVYKFWVPESASFTIYIHAYQGDERSNLFVRLYDFYSYDLGLLYIDLYSFETANSLTNPHAWNGFYVIEITGENIAETAGNIDYRICILLDAQDDFQKGEDAPDDEVNYAGIGVYTNSLSGYMYSGSYVSDRDRFDIDVQSGQTLEVVVNPFEPYEVPQPVDIELYLNGANKYFTVNDYGVGSTETIDVTFDVDGTVEVDIYAASGWDTYYQISIDLRGGGGDGGGGDESLTITQPVSTDNWERDTLAYILWEWTGTIDFVDLELHKDGAWFETIEEDVVNDGSYDWKIPLSPLDSDDYQIVIKHPESDTIDYSDFFTISGGPTPCLNFIIDSPQSDVWMQGLTYDIEWRSLHTGNGEIPDTVNVEVIKDGDCYDTIATAIENSGTYEWEIPTNYPDSENYRIKIYDTEDASYCGLSYNFEISGGFDTSQGIVITQPNQYSEWVEGNEYTIVWSAPEDFERIDIDLLNNGENVKSISFYYENTGQFQWKIRYIDETCSTFQIEITAYESETLPSISGLSDYFTIVCEEDAEGTDGDGSDNGGGNDDNSSNFVDNLMDQIRSIPGFNFELLLLIIPVSVLFIGYKYKKKFN